MVKVITYGTFDLLHRGHVRLLERAKQLGDYLIVGVTSDDFDRVRGKVNVQQPLVDRLEAVRSTGLADEVIVEEYIGQKIDDIRRLNIDVFTVGSDWIGHFDYLNNYCKVVYLDRTLGISSTELRAEGCSVRLGLVGGRDAYELAYLNKVYRESRFVNGAHVEAVYLPDLRYADRVQVDCSLVTEDFDELLSAVDAVLVLSHPDSHYEQISKALQVGVHVLCEEPVALDESCCDSLFDLAEERGLVLSGAIRTAFCTAFDRLLLQVESGRIGRVVSVEARCTSLREFSGDSPGEWGSFHAWGATALLPALRLMGDKWDDLTFVTIGSDKIEGLDSYTRLELYYPNSLASVSVAKGVKSEGDLVISGTEGYAYVPSPWWKTDYFELRYENPALNKRFFYQLEGEGIRNQLVAFIRALNNNRSALKVDVGVSRAIAMLMRLHGDGRNTKSMR